MASQQVSKRNQLRLFFLYRAPKIAFFAICSLLFTMIKLAVEKNKRLIKRIGKRLFQHIKSPSTNGRRASKNLLNVVYFTSKRSNIITLVQVARRSLTNFFWRHWQNNLLQERAAQNFSQRSDQRGWQSNLRLRFYGRDLQSSCNCRP
jgi:hypothetical protein